MKPSPLLFVLFLAFCANASADTLPPALKALDAPAPSYLANAKVAAVWQGYQTALANDTALRAEILRLNDLLATRSSLPATTATAEISALDSRLSSLVQQTTNLSQQLSLLSATLATMRVDQSAAAQSLGAIEQSTQALTQRIAEQRRVIMVGPGAAWTIDERGDVSIPSSALVGVSGIISIVPDTTTTTPPASSTPDTTPQSPITNPPSPPATPTTTTTTYIDGANTLILTQPAGTITINGVAVAGLAGATGIYDDGTWYLASTAAGTWYRFIDTTGASATAAPATALARKDK